MIMSVFNGLLRNVVIAECIGMYASMTLLGRARTGKRGKYSP
jgi:hypothetical protein